MQKLNELVGLAAAYENAETRKEAFEIVERFNESCGFKSILDIDKAFRELEKRAEAAEAKLAELEKQEPSALRWRFKHGRDLPAMAWTYVDNKKYFDDVREMEGAEIEEVFTHPAPAVSLAELVPEEITSDLREKIIDICDGFEVGDSGANEIWKACRATILINIEESK